MEIWEQLTDPIPMRDITHLSVPKMRDFAFDGQIMQNADLAASQ